MHPITESTHSKPIVEDDHSSQSKINHYSKNQEHIVLSSDFHKKDAITDLSHVKKSIPSLIELKPYASGTDGGAAYHRIQHHHHHHHSAKATKYEEPSEKYSKKIYSENNGYEDDDNDDEFLPSIPNKSGAIKSVPAPDLSKYIPIGGGKHHNADGGNEYHEVGGEYKISDAELSQYGQTFKSEPDAEVVVGVAPFNEYAYNQITPSFHKPTAIGSGQRFKGTVKKLSPITTAGLKHYGGGASKPIPNKFFSRSLPVRNDYASYFRRTPKSASAPSRLKFTAVSGEGPVLFPANDDLTYEQRVASARMIQTLLARKKQGRSLSAYNHYY